MANRNGGTWQSALSPYIRGSGKGKFKAIAPDGKEITVSGSLNKPVPFAEIADHMIEPKASVKDGDEVGRGSQTFPVDASGFAAEYAPTYTVSKPDREESAAEERSHAAPVGANGASTN